MSRILYTSGREKKMSRPGRLKVLPLIIGILAVFAVAGGVVILRRPAWQIRVIVIEGLRVIPDGAMRAHIADALGGTYLRVIPRSSLALAQEHTIAEGLKKSFPPIQDVAVHKQFPDRLDIAVTERRLWSIFCNDLNTAASSSCVAMDETGYAYAASPAAYGVLILRVRSDGAAVPVGSFAVSEEIMDRLRRVTDRMPASAGSAPLGFELSREIGSEFRAVMPEGYRIIFRRDDDLENALRVLKKVLDEEIGEKRTRLDYIDLRFGNKVFYKMR